MLKFRSRIKGLYCSDISLARPNISAENIKAPLSSLFGYIHQNLLATLWFDLTSLIPAGAGKDRHEETELRIAIEIEGMRRRQGETDGEGTGQVERPGQDVIWGIRFSCFSWREGGLCICIQGRVLLQSVALFPNLNSRLFPEHFFPNWLFFSTWQIWKRTVRFCCKDLKWMDEWIEHSQSGLGSTKKKPRSSFFWT